MVASICDCAPADKHSEVNTLIRCPAAPVVCGIKGYFGTMEQATCGSLMGRQHSAEARSMTVRASAAAVAMCGLLSLVCSPLLLALPVVLVAYFAAEAVFAVLYW